ncbi:MAG: preprotein translocase subunit SecY, partial [Patescibacteria group bacterium]
MNKFWLKIRLIFADTTLRRRVLFTGLALILFRFTAAIPIPGVNTNQLNNLLSGNQFLGLLNIFSGGGLSNLSIVMLGVGPFITASIIMQLLTIMFPSLKEMYQESGEAGRRKFTQYSRIITVPLAALQGLALISLLTSQGVIGVLPLSQKIVNLVVVVAGAILLMWLGELISEFGIGNGTSLLIFAGIVSQIPSSVAQIIATFSASD